MAVLCPGLVTGRGVWMSQASWGALGSLPLASWGSQASLHLDLAERQRRQRVFRFQAPEMSDFFLISWG